MSSIRRITKQNKEYPRLLKEIFKPPALYVRGNFNKADDFALAVVGTRKPTYYGQQTADKIVYDLAQSGLTIISGLALGVDTIVHKTTLKAGGRTIAVLGAGVDDKSLYPQENRKLALKIEKSGAVISEYPLGTSAKPGYFPQRNRIISGLALGTLVIEAGFKSGALITAHCALDQNREVFCVPGSIFSEKSSTWLETSLFKTFIIAFLARSCFEFIIKKLRQGLFINAGSIITFYYEFLGRIERSIH